MKYVLSCLFCGIVLAGLHAQQGSIKRARTAFDQMDYQEAIRRYTALVDKNHDNYTLKHDLAEAYRKVGNTEDAEYWYGQIASAEESRETPENWLYYGMMLQRNGKCELAQVYFSKYLEAKPDELRARYLQRACDREEELMEKNRGMYEVVHLSINGIYDDFSPVLYKGGLVFATERDDNPFVNREAAWTGRPFLNLYYSARQVLDADAHDYLYSAPEAFSKDLNSRYHDATVCFSPDGEGVFFTRNNYISGKTGKDDEGTVRLKIYYAHRRGNAWGKLESLPFDSDEYSVAHPAISTDGQRLYFASDMPGGHGGMDLYVSELENGRWGPPLNLGPRINTEGNELFPYYSNDQRLYFASDGHIGLGGLDIYHMDYQGYNQWGEIINIGYPINSKSDDFGIAMDDDRQFGYFSSDREGGVGGDDIYAFKRNAVEMEIYVYDELSLTPVEGAEVRGSFGPEPLITGPRGRAKLVVKLDECFDFQVKKEGYFPAEKSACSPASRQDVPFLVEIPLKQPATFTVAGTVISQDTGQPVEGAEVILSNDCKRMAPKPYVTGPDGRYSFELDKECCYELKAMSPGFLAARSSGFCTRGLDASRTFDVDLYLQPYLASKAGGRIDAISPPEFFPSPQIIAEAEANEPIAICCSPLTPGPSGEIDGSLTFLLHIYYDFDQAYIRADAEPELEKLYSIMVDNPELIVEIGSHTDSRGSHSYNDRLSQRRAEAAVRWLRDRGISRERLKAKGYGETINVNQCANNVPCSELEHQLNRRTEFRVVGLINGTRYDSQAPSDVRVGRPCEGCPF